MLLDINTINEGVKFDAIILMLKIKNLERLYKRYGTECFTIINQIYHIFHTIGVIHHGEIYNKHTSLIWKISKKHSDMNIKSYFIKIGIFI